MDTLQIGVHFDAFRKFLLLEDGEFGHCLCNQIFEKVRSNNFDIFREDFLLTRMIVKGFS